MAQSRKGIWRYRYLASLPVAAMAAAVLMPGHQASAVPVTLLANDAPDASSFNSGLNWSDSTAPSAGNDYFTANRVLRTPPSGSATFGGGSLQIDNSGSLSFKTPGEITVNNLILAAGGTISQASVGGANIATLAGNLSVIGTSAITSNDAARTMTVNSNISGAGGLGIYGAGLTILGGNNAGYTGTMTVNDSNLRTSASGALSSSSILNFTGTSTLDLFNTTQTVSNLRFDQTVNSTTTINGAGGTLNVSGGGNLQFGPGGLDPLNVAISLASTPLTTVNMSGLSNFNYTAAGNIFRVGLQASTQNTAALGQVATVTLAQNNTITAATLAIGDVSANSDGGASTLNLGQANIINANTITIGAAGRSDANLSFATSGSNATIRGTTGGSSAVTTWNIGSVNQFQTATAQTSFAANVNFINGTLDAIVNNMTIGNANIVAGENRVGTENADFTMGAGTLQVANLTLGRISGTGTVGTQGLHANGIFTLNHAAGVVNVATMTLADNLITAGNPANARSVSGVFNLVNGTLRATTIQQGSTDGNATVTRGLNWTTGTIENTTGADLTISGVPINLIAGTHRFNATGSNFITVNADSPISGAGTITKAGPGTLVLLGDNTFGAGTFNFGSGNTLAQSVGGLRLGAAAALGNHTLINMDANNLSESRIELVGNVVFNDYDIVTAGRSNARTTGVTLVNVSGNNTWTGDITLDATGGGYAIRSDAGLLTLNGALQSSLPAANGTRTWELGGAGNITLNGVVQEISDGTLALTKFGAGTLTLANANSYTGLTTISEGNLVVTNDNALGATANGVFINGAGGSLAESALTLNNVNIGLEPIRMSSNSNVATDRAAIRTAGGINTIGGDILLQGASGGVNMLLANHVLNLDGNVTLDAGAAVTTQFRGTGTGNINGIVNLGAAAFNKTDTGTWNINTAGHTWAATVVAVGTLNIGLDNALPTGTLLTLGQGDATSATFNLNGFNQTVGGLGSNIGAGGTKQITNTGGDAAVLTVNNAAANTYAGQINGNLGLTKNNAGILTLGGVNSYTGDTLINQGVLALSGAGSIDNSPVISIGTGATFNVAALSGGYNLLSGQSIIGNGSIVGDVITDAGSLLSPGFSIGTLSFTDNLDIDGNILIEIDPDAVGQKIDIINVAGILDISDAVIDFDILGSFTGPGAYVFMTYGSLVGEFNIINNVPSGYQVFYTFGGQNQIAFVSIPEPATLSLLALGGVALLRRRRAVR